MLWRPWKDGKEPDEEGAAAWVDWQSDSDLIRREGDEENMNAIWMNAMEYPALRACMRSKMVEGEGVRLEDGKILQMEKGKAEMDKVTGVKAAYIRKTRQVLNYAPLAYDHLCREVPRRCSQELPFGMHAS